ncbi:hypothetical protein EV384_4611 [Micromonospora kangleipakensis]|uniref:Uncharacterized protein n=1 Tax=Micromonospora kangleipakensis TaxID=1077942 RepID=A0A4Q8BF67_9ACTN|nr:CATRA conflict system CASPASE/TPR repeat-associated protein [Micromonospora kangleipakensis]RZU76015.1 hypothetical protein EV384_4611 [Micromonospora kangleipakensis]
MIAPLRDPAVLFHVFTRAESVLAHEDTPSRLAVTQLWERARSREMTKSILHRWPVELELPRDGGQAGALTVLGAAQCTAPHELRQILVYQQRDIVAVSVLEAVQGGTKPWSEFDVGWLDEWTAPARDMVGTVLVHVGLARDAEERRLPALLRQLPDPPSRWSVWRPSPEQLIAELPSARAGRRGADRRLFAIAGRDGGRVQSAWFTNPPHRGLPRFTRYLEHSARLRHQSRLLAAALPGIRTTVAAVNRDTAALHGALQAKGPALDRVLRAEPMLVEVDAGRRRVVGYLADVRAMAATAQLAVHNLAELVGPGRVAESDRELGQWTLEQLRVEETYLESVRLKASEVGGLAATEVNGSLQRGRDNLVLAQVSVLSALTLALTAAQALGYQPPLPHRTFGPLVSLAGAIALALPTTVLRWWRGAGPDREWPIIDVACVALTGAALGWFIETWCTARQPWLAIGCAVGGGVLAGLSAGWRIQRLRRAVAAVKPSSGDVS